MHIYICKIYILLITLSLFSLYIHIYIYACCVICIQPIAIGIAIPIAIAIVIATVTATAIAFAIEAIVSAPGVAGDAPPDADVAMEVDGVSTGQNSKRCTQIRNKTAQLHEHGYL